MPAWSPLALLGVVVSLILLHVFVPSTRPWAWKVSLAIGVVMLPIHLWLALSWVPPEAYMSNVGRILYAHVPHVWMCLLAFTLNLGCSIGYLLKKSWVTDALGEASAEVGVYFGSIGVALGSIWAKPTWGVWWDWDPRLISTTVMLLVYIGYLAFRAFAEDPDRRATWSATLGILGYPLLAIVWFSVKWWNSLHQVQSSPSTVDKPMVVVLRWGSVTALSFLFVFLVQRYRIARASQALALQLPERMAPAKQVVA
jgi:heme exporter protein C